MNGIAFFVFNSLLKTTDSLVCTTCQLLARFGPLTVITNSSLSVSSEDFDFKIFERNSCNTKLVPCPISNMLGSFAEYFHFFKDLLTEGISSHDIATRAVFLTKFPGSTTFPTSGYQPTWLVVVEYLKCEIKVQLYQILFMFNQIKIVNSFPRIFQVNQNLWRLQHIVVQSVWMKENLLHFKSSWAETVTVCWVFSYCSYLTVSG